MRNSSITFSTRNCWLLRVAVTDEKLLPIELIKQRKATNVPDNALAGFKYPSSRKTFTHPRVSGIVEPKMAPLLAGPYRRRKPVGRCQCGKLCIVFKPDAAQLRRAPRLRPCGVSGRWWLCDGVVHLRCQAETLLRSIAAIPAPIDFLRGIAASTGMPRASSTSKGVRKDGSQ